MKNQPRRSKIKGFFAKLGPGVISGAAGDDPSGVATYSITGAQAGTGLLWTAWISWPMMAVVQMMCARIGLVTGEGLSRALSKKFPKPVLIIMCLALFTANIINIGADLSGMADALQMLTGIDSKVIIPLLGVAIGFSVIHFNYAQICQVLKWLVLVLFAYIITAFIASPDWSVVLHDTMVPSIPKGSDGLSMIVAILGTTISPYLFFWQASQEVEEQKSQGKTRLFQRLGAKDYEIRDRIIDVTTGTFFSNLIMYAIILTAALTLHTHGITHITTTREAAEALKPIAGKSAMLLFTMGLVGVGLLSIPTLCGSAGYAFAEVFGWTHGLNKKLKHAKAFYAVISFATLGGVLIDFVGVNPIKALYWSAIINGALAPFLMVGILIVARDKRIMQNQPSHIITQGAMAIITVAMFGALVGMLIF